MRRLVAAAAVLAAACLVPAAAAMQPDPPEPAARVVRSWAAPQIRAVLAAGVMTAGETGFRPDDRLTHGELADALAALGMPGPAPAYPGRRVTIRELDARLVAAAGLADQARALRLAARDAGLQPTAMLGTETVARLLGLRTNHPQGQDELEPLPTQPASRAEAAYSFARFRELTDWHRDEVRTAVASFVLPPLSELQREVTARALRFVGFPYVWAGMSERRQQLYYGTVPGGFDCSGFVWRVYKLEPYPIAPAIAAMLKGRTTYDMSGEVTPTLRIPPQALQPGDILFFGSRGPKSKPAEVTHAGIYVGAGWFVHSSANGVTLQPLRGWYAERLAWARRPAAEAGLSA
jgi:cell wall-associated NlpC family hydrolase